MPKHLNLILALSVLSFSVSPLFIRFAGNPGLDFAFWRAWFSVLLLLPFAVYKWRDFKNLSGVDISLLSLSGVLLGIHFYLWIESLSFTSVASSTVIVTATPIFAAVFGWLFLKEKIDAKTTIGIAIGFLGTCLLAYAEPKSLRFPAANWGNLLSFLAMICIGLYLLLGRKLRKHTSWLVYVFVVYLISAITTSILLWKNGKGLNLEHNLLFWTFLAALLPGIVGHGGMNYAVKFHHPAFLSLLVLTEPLLSSVFAFFIWKEAPNALSLFGMLLILLGVAYPLLKGKRGEV